jgi:molybdate transport system substrate-binding protein
MKKLLLALILCFASTFASAQDLLVAAASDLSFVMPEIASRFQQQTGKKVAFTFGSSGNFYQQIRNGAPFDLFFSADEQYPARLQQEGFAEPGTLYPYALGKLVLFVPANSKLNIAQGLNVLLSPEVRKISIANPQHAPYGRAAVDALNRAGLYNKVKDKLVLGENISQAAQFIQSGNADAGIIALSLASAPPMRSRGRFTEVPSSEYAPIRQAAILVKASKRKGTAREFLNFLKQPEIVNLMSRYGFTQP